MHVVAAKAVCFKEALEPEFKTYMSQVMINAKTMAKTIVGRGIDIVQGGTENHMILVDLRNKEVTGKDSEYKLGLANITVNKNAVPNDPESPFVTSGIRLGTPAVTTRGFKEDEIIQISNWICDIVLDLNNEQKIEEIKNKALSLCKDFPVYK